jgi:hypothetical protein
MHRHPFIKRDVAIIVLNGNTSYGYHAPWVYSENDGFLHLASLSEMIALPWETEVALFDGKLTGRDFTKLTTYDIAEKSKELRMNKETPKHPMGNPKEPFVILRVNLDRAPGATHYELWLFTEETGSNGPATLEAVLKYPWHKSVGVYQGEVCGMDFAGYTVDRLRTLAIQRAENLVKMQQTADTRPRELLFGFSKQFGGGVMAKIGEGICDVAEFGNAQEVTALVTLLNLRAKS